jgi:hypothetical protein
MLLPIKPILDRRPRRNGTNLISIQYCHSSDKRIVLYTGVAVPARFWSKKQQKVFSDLPQQFGQAAELNMRLQKMIRVVEDIVSFTLHKVEDPIACLKNVFEPDFDPATLPERLKEMMQASPDPGVVNLDFFYQLDDYIKTKRRKVSAGMIRTYNAVASIPRHRPPRGRPCCAGEAEGRRAATRGRP